MTITWSFFIQLFLDYELFLGKIFLENFVFLDFKKRNYFLIIQEKICIWMTLFVKIITITITPKVT
jgi:hypothetical protein